MTSERRKVLIMLHESKIDVDEAEGLLDALEYAPEDEPELKVEIITADPEMQKILDYARKAASSNLPVLIVGESGTGKELVARMIHQESSRRDKKFVFLSCASLPEILLESEIFGHAPRAFTGAQRLKPGFASLADGGTIFLDAVDELPMELQVKLLRYIETGEFRRVGGTEVIRTDVRIIAATNKDLRAEVHANRFRGDLLDCLNAISLEIPPLRERVTDIPLLADYFLKKRSTQSGSSVPAIAPEAMDSLTSYDWPGNVRELQKTIERALVVSDDDMILPEYLSSTGSLSEQMDTIERKLVLEALEREEWDRAKTAEALGIPKPTLNYKMAKHNIANGESPDTPTSK